MLNLSDCAVVDRDMTQETPPDRLRWPEYGQKLRGWLAADFGKPISANPNDPYTEDWYDFREGWFTRNRGEDAVIPCETWDEVPQG